MQAHWPNISTSVLQSVPPSMPPLQQQAEGGVLASQFGNGLSVDASNVKNFQELRSPTLADSCRSFLPASDSTAQFPGEALIEPSSASSACVQISRPTSYSSANGNNKAESLMKSLSWAIVSDASQSLGGGGSSSGGGNTSSLSMSSSTLTAPANQQKKQSALHKIHPIGYTEQRGSGVSQKFGSGSDWHRRGFHGRNQNSGAGKNFTSSKMKQIYVPKSAASVPTTTV